VDGFSRASSTAAATNGSALFGTYRWGWGFSTSQDFEMDASFVPSGGRNGDPPAAARSPVVVIEGG
jgi:hypothetical protein